jgi:transposase, IS5 family
VGREVRGSKRGGVRQNGLWDGERERKKCGERMWQALTELGNRTVVIPRTGRPGAARQHVEKRRAFRRTIKWRTGCEGRISTLKRGYGWDRTRLDSLEGAKTWTGQGVFTHNLTRIAALTA